MLQAQISQTKTININTPVEGTTQHVSSSTGIQFQFDFEQSKASFERSGTDLSIEIDGGGTIILDKFFEVGNNELPAFVMPGGDIITAAGLLKAFNPHFDISTAAGPASDSSAHSGVGSYDDNSGHLLDGVARLGSLGTDSWGHATQPGTDNSGVQRVATTKDAPWSSPSNIIPTDGASTANPGGETTNLVGNAANHNGSTANNGGYTANQGGSTANPGGSTASHGGYTATHGGGPAVPVAPIVPNALPVFVDSGHFSMWEDTLTGASPASSGVTVAIGHVLATLSPEYDPNQGKWEIKNDLTK